MVDELTVRAELRDDLSRPLRNVTERVEDLSDELEDTQREARGAGTALGRLARRGVGGLGGELIKTSGRLGRFTRSIGRGLARAARTGLIGLGALAAGVGALSVKLVGLASDANEVGSQFETVFGDNLKAMQRWVDGMHEATGIARAELQAAASTFGVFGQAAGVAGDELPGFSQDLVQAGLDLSSFYNVDPEEAFLALRSGLAGEAEPLRKFGIFLSDATMKAKAATMGLTGELDESEKVMVRQAIVLESLGAAQGDLDRTSDQLANKQRALKGRLTEAGTAIGTALLPYVTDVTVALEEWVQRIMPDLEAGLERLPGQLDALQEAGGRVVGVWREGGTYGETVAAALAEVGVESDAIAPLVDTVADAFGDVVTILSDLLLPAFTEATKLLPGISSPLEAAAAVLDVLADNADTLVPIVGALTAGYVAFRGAILAYNVVTAAANALTFLKAAATSGLAAAQLGATAATGGLAAGTATLNAIMLMNPVVLVVAAIAALAAGLVIAYRRSETFRRIVDGAFSAVKVAGLTLSEMLVGAFRSLVNFFLSAAEDIVGGAARVARALGMDGLADKLDSAHGDLRSFRDNANARLSEIETDLRMKIDDEQARQELGEFVSTLEAAGFSNGRGAAAWSARLTAQADAVGDGWGAPTSGRGIASRGSGGGNALSTVRRNMGGLGGLRVTSTYRTPAHNAAVGGSPTSYHLDRANPATDVAGPPAALDQLAARLRRTPHRELLWRVAGHYDHLHYAHTGGMVEPSWPTLPGLKADERPAVLQLGERVQARAEVSAADTGGRRGGGNVVVQGPLIGQVVASSDVDVEEAARRGLRKAIRDAEER